LLKEAKKERKIDRDEKGGGEKDGERAKGRKSS
jgi:hypothetical protein